MKQFFKKRVLALLCAMTCMLSMTAYASDVEDSIFNLANNPTVGMGIVCAVALLVVCVIVLFKRVSDIQTEVDEIQGPKKVTETTQVVETTVEEENLIDDLELVAVITAAIAAMENTSVDGLVVRSIKRSTNNKWKRS